MCSKNVCHLNELVNEKVSDETTDEFAICQKESDCLTQIAALRKEGPGENELDTNHCQNASLPQRNRTTSTASAVSGTNSEGFTINNSDKRACKYCYRTLYLVLT